MEGLMQEVPECRKYGLAANGNHVIFGEGNPGARILDY